MLSQTTCRKNKRRLRGILRSWRRGCNRWSWRRGSCRRPWTGLLLLQRCALRWHRNRLPVLGRGLFYGFSEMRCCSAPSFLTWRYCPPKSHWHFLVCLFSTTHAYWVSLVLCSWFSWAPCDALSWPRICRAPCAMNSINIAPNRWVMGKLYRFDLMEGSHQRHSTSF